MKKFSGMFKKSLKYKQQMADSDCGAACLAMILSYYGYEISVASARKACESFGVPQSSRSIVMAARNLGMSAQLFRAEIDVLESINQPCILYWRFNHFVVFTGVKGKNYSIADPSLGKRLLDREEFGNSYTGIGIMLEPGPAFQKRKNDYNHCFWKYLRKSLGSAPIYRLLAVLLICAIGVQILSLVLPALTLYIVDNIIPGRIEDLMIPLLFAIMLLSINVGLINYLRSQVVVKLQSKVDQILLNGFMEQLLRLPMSFFIERSSGDIQSRMNSNTVIRDWLSSNTISALLDFVMIFSYVLILGFITPLFAALAFFLGIIQFSIHLFTADSMKEKLAAEMKTLSLCQGYMIELLSGIMTIKGSSAEDQIRNAWGLKLHNYIVSGKRKSLEDAKILAFTSTLSLITPVILFWFSVTEYFSGQLSLGAVLAVNALAAMILNPLASLMRTIRHFQLFVTHVERIGDLWRHENEEYGSKTILSLRSPASIRFENVNFKYGSSSGDVLKNINIEIEFGKRIGIVGPSGSGKSTFIALLLGFYRPQSGHILLNNNDLFDYNIKEFRKHIGYVAQNPFVFNSSIRNNIALTNLELSLEQVRWAASIAGLEEDIDSMPMGYNSIIGESGVKISGGQRQRLSIARAIVNQPDILIFDEATSSLDSVTESVISQNVSKLSCTQILASHRFSTVKNCDLIYVFENGKIAAQGKHEELLQKNDFYYNCAISQSHEKTIVTL